MALEVRSITEQDLPRLQWIGREAFRAETPAARWLRSGRGLFEDGDLRAIILVEPSGQYFGGQVVSSAVISFMAVAPEHRGRGLGAFLIRQVVAECERDGISVAVHYPRVFSTYRRVGFEFAGVHIRYSVPVGAAAPFNGARIETWGDSDLDEIVCCYEQFARASNGLLQRSPEWWQERVLDEYSDQPLYRFCTRADGRITSYIAYTQQPIYGQEPHFFSLNARDLVWSDAQSAQALLGFMGHHAPLGRSLQWSGPIDEPLSTFLDIEIRQELASRWMMRLINVEQALLQRGYPRGLRACVQLAISDAVLSTNSGAFQIEVEDGQAEVTPLRAARVRTDVGTLAALYTGWLSGRDAARIGRLQGATEQDVQSLELMFAGPKPWLIESV